MRWVPFLLAAVISGCGSPNAADPELDRAAALSLVFAAPGEWPTAGRAALARGPSIVPAVVDALRREPNAPGAQLALAVLGKLADPRAADLLERFAIGSDDHGYEACLALGRIGDRTRIGVLREIVDDRSRTPTRRAAAACGLLDLGETETSLPFLHAILLAGTPAGVETSNRYGLPDRARWALEREMTIDALRRHTGDDFGLDPDSPWPALERGAERMYRATIEGPR